MSAYRNIPAFVRTYRDGCLVDSDASGGVPITSRGVELGEGAFATLRGYRGRCFRPAAHIRILEEGAAMFGLRLGFDTAGLSRLADEAARSVAPVPAHGHGLSGSDAYVRITVTSAASDVESTRERECECESLVAVVARPLSVPSADDYQHGIRAAVATQRRVPRACVSDPNVKTTSYALPVLARREAQRQGAAEAIMLCTEGSLACGAMSNLFLIAGHTLFTPPTSTGCRAGITRDAVCEIASDAGFEVRTEPLDPGMLFDADEVFLTNTRIECLPVAHVLPLRSDAYRPTKAARLGLPFAGTERIRCALRNLIDRETRDGAPVES